METDVSYEYDEIFGRRAIDFGSSLEGFGGLS